MKIPSWFKRKKTSSKNQTGLSIVFGIIFALMGFLGSVYGNFLWWWQQNHPKTIIVTGAVSGLAFFGLIFYLIIIANKYLQSKN